MNVADYIVSFLIEKEVKHVFGYSGAQVSYLMNAFWERREEIESYTNYHEQGASFAACAYGQASLKPGVCYTSSGPGVANLISGIANAYFDSIPTIFLTGQVNSFETKGVLKVRQKGFQELDVVSMVSEITKYAIQINDKKDIRYILEQAWHYATEGRPGPVLIDIPSNIAKEEIDLDDLRPFPIYNFCSTNQENISIICQKINDSLKQASRPCILVGAGVKYSGMSKEFTQWINSIGVPVVSSMLAVDVLSNCPTYYGFIGTYGLRHAHFILEKSDLIITIGSRLDVRQVGLSNNFAENAKIIRIDVDPKELTNQITKNEEDLIIDIKELIPSLLKFEYPKPNIHTNWVNVCNEIKDLLKNVDLQQGNYLVNEISKLINEDYIVTTDVGQNQVWVHQSFDVQGQQILTSGGFGAMGYSLPAAIGAHYSTGKKAVSFNGDGGFQMNMQELQFIVREELPVKVIVINNSSLGMVGEFQAAQFSSACIHTKKEGGYTSPNFKGIAAAYNIDYCSINNIEEIKNAKELLDNNLPAFIEINLTTESKVYPKLVAGNSYTDMYPPIPADLYDKVNKL